MLVGAAVASRVDPVLGLPLAFASHFALDAIPHYDGYYPKRPYQILPLAQLLTDFLLGTVLLAIFTNGRPDQTYLVVAALVAILPDIFYGLQFNYNLLGFLKPLQEFHQAIQLPLRPPVFILTTVVTALVAVWILGTF